MEIIKVDIAMVAADAITNPRSQEIMFSGCWLYLEDWNLKHLHFYFSVMHSCVTINLRNWLRWLRF